MHVLSLALLAHNPYRSSPSQDGVALPTSLLAPQWIWCYAAEQEQEQRGMGECGRGMASCFHYAVEAEAVTDAKCQMSAER